MYQLSLIFTIGLFLCMIVGNFQEFLLPMTNEYNNES